MAHYYKNRKLPQYKFAVFLKTGVPINVSDKYSAYYRYYMDDILIYKYFNGLWTQKRPE